MNTSGSQEEQFRKSTPLHGFEFVSRDCKNYAHDLCMNKWEGLGIQVHCICFCHNKANDVVTVYDVGGVNGQQAALDLVVDPEANATRNNSPSKKGIQEDEH